MIFDPQKLRTFKEKIDAIKEINNCNKNNIHFLFFKKSHMDYSKIMTFQDIKESLYVIVMSERTWTCSIFTNRSMTLLGMFDEDLHLVKKIPLPNGYFLVDIKFKEYRGALTNNQFKPIFVIEGHDNELTELTIDSEKENGYPEDFYNLYNKALELK